MTTYIRRRDRLPSTPPHAEKKLTPLAPAPFLSLAVSLSQSPPDPHAREIPTPRAARAPVSASSAASAACGRHGRRCSSPSFVVVVTDPERSRRICVAAPHSSPSKPLTSPERAGVSMATIPFSRFLAGDDQQQQQQCCRDLRALLPCPAARDSEEERRRRRTGCSGPGSTMRWRCIGGRPTEGGLHVDINGYGGFSGMLFVRVVGECCS